MSSKADFTPEDWELIQQGPTNAGMIVVTAERGGQFRESFAMARAYAEAREQHGESELLDEIVTAKPKVDRTRFRSNEERKAHALQRLGEAVAALERQATPEEVEDYRSFVLSLTDRVAAAHSRGGEPVTDTERAAIDEIAATLGRR
jgi:hypothetical protein